jgi:hypothetical protein
MWKGAAQLDAYAAAYAEAGNYEEALKFQAQAIKFGGSSAKEEMEEHARRYRQRRPYRDEPVLKR